MSKGSGSESKGAQSGKSTCSRLADDVDRATGGRGR